jgi:multiple sugar transport system permease protein
MSLKHGRMKKAFTCFSAILMILLTLVMLVPLFWFFLSSLKPAGEIIQYPPTFFPAKTTLDHYFTVWDSIPLFRYTLNTLVFAGGVTFFSLIFDSMAGYAFARLHFKYKKTLFYIILITMMIPFQVIMIPLFVESYLMGILDTYQGLILPRASSAFGKILLYTFLITLPRDLEEAARIDGLDEYRLFFSIMMPLCKSAMVTLGIILFMNNWNDLIYPLMLTNSTSMRTLSAGLAVFVGDKVIQYGPTFAATTVSLLPLLILFAFLQRHFIQGVATSGLKA